MKFSVVWELKKLRDEEAQPIHISLNRCPICEQENTPANYYRSPQKYAEDEGVFKYLVCNSHFKLVQYGYRNTQKTETELTPCSELP